MTDGGAHYGLHCYGACKPKKNAARLEKAVRDGAACPNANIVKDNYGNTFVRYDWVIGKHTNADLKKIGY